MPDNDLWIPIVMFISIGVVLSFWLYFRFRTRDALQKTVQFAMEKGHDLTPEMVQALGQPKTAGHTDMRRGVIGVAIGVGFVAFAFIVGEREAVRPLLAVGSFPFLIGAAYLALWRFAGDNN